MPPALSDRTKNGGPSRRPGTRRRAPCAFCTAVPPCSTKPGRPKIRRGRRASGSIISRNWVKTSTSSWRASDLLAISRQTREFAAVLPPATAVAEHCAGWLQTCLSRISVASTRPRRFIPSASSSVLRSRSTTWHRGRLLPGQLAEARRLDLVGQIGDDRAVGLHAAQDVGRHQSAQRRDTGSCVPRVKIPAARLELPWPSRAGRD